MGIKSLNYLIKKYSPNAINNRFLCTYENKVVAIDTSIYLYRYIYRSGNPLELFVKQIMRFLKNKVIPLYIFDGKPPIEKADVLNDRSSRKNVLLYKQYKLNNAIALKKGLKDTNEVGVEIDNDGEILVDKKYIEKMENICKECYDKEYEDRLLEYDVEDLVDELDTVQKNIIIINDKVIQECKNLFTLMGIPYIVAKGEAEALCAALIKKNYVHACLSEDTDILPNGGTLFINTFNENNNKVIEYDLNKILNSFEMTYEQFVDMCILCKCDYTTTIENIGRERAYQLIKEHKSIEKIIEKIKDNPRYVVPENFDYKRARELFLNCGDGENFEEIKKKIKLNQPQVDKVISLIENTSKINTITDIKRNLRKFYNELEKRNETSLHNFYTTNT